jgi:arsenate reductase
VTKVLFVCVANGGRSVLAERIFNQLAHGRHEARSAGSEPGAHVHPVVVEALAEIGIDASDHVPVGLDQETIEWSDLIVSTCAEEACPVTYGRLRIRWEFPDPKNLPLEQVRPIRDDIEKRVRELVAELDNAP